MAGSRVSTVSKAIHFSVSLGWLSCLSISFFIPWRLSWAHSYSRLTTSHYFRNFCRKKELPFAKLPSSLELNLVGGYWVIWSSLKQSLGLGVGGMECSDRPGLGHLPSDWVCPYLKWTSCRGEGVGPPRKIKPLCLQAQQISTLTPFWFILLTQKHAKSLILKIPCLKPGSLHPTARAPALSSHTDKLWKEFLLSPLHYLPFFLQFGAIWLLPPPFYWNFSPWVSNDPKLSPLVDLSFLTSSNWALWSSFLKKKSEKVKTSSSIKSYAVKLSTSPETPN